MDTTADASPSSTRELTIAAIRRDLSAFAAAVRATPVQDGAAWHALARRWGYVTDSLDDSDAEMPSELGGLLNACSRGMCQLGQGAGSGDERAALAVRIVAVREDRSRSRPAPSRGCSSDCRTTSGGAPCAGRARPRGGAGA
jgi:hypothetical protein